MQFEESPIVGSAQDPQETQDNSQPAQVQEIEA